MNAEGCRCPNIRVNTLILHAPTCKERTDTDQPTFSAQGVHTKGKGNMNVTEIVAVLLTGGYS